MRRFLAQLAAFALLQAGLGGLVLARYTVSDSTNYLAETVAKHQALRSAGPGKLVLVGGSSVAFGFASDRLATALDRPVVNLGLAAGLGVEYLLAEVRPALRSGDLLVLSFEYDHFSRGPDRSTGGGRGFDAELLLLVLEFRPTGVAQLSGTHLRWLLARGLGLAGAVGRRGLNSWLVAFRTDRTRPPPTPRGFNSWGDFVAHRTLPAEGEQAPLGGGRLMSDPRNFPNPALLRRLAKFVTAMTERGVTVAWSFPPRPTEVLEREGDRARQLESALRRLPGLIVLDTPTDHAYLPELFYDSAHHLTGPGADRRTDKLVAALAAQLPRGNPAHPQAFPD